MQRRIPWTTGLGALLVVVSLATLRFYADAQGQQGQAGRSEGEGQQHHAFHHCAKACTDCQLICDACNMHCTQLAVNGQKEHLKTARTCQDCATVCSAAAQIVARHGPFSDVICTACADACARCGKACEELGHDKLMKECAEECRKCEKACREMLKDTGKGGSTSR
jgi:hypothetical protein